MAAKLRDRSAAVAYNLCDSAKILDIVEVDTENKALVLDIARKSPPPLLHG